MENDLIHDELFQILFNWGKMSIKQIQECIPGMELFDIATKLNHYIDNELIEVIQTTESPMYYILNNNVSEDLKNSINEEIFDKIKFELKFIDEKIDKDWKLTYKLFNKLDKKWKIINVTNLLPYYIDLKQKFNLHIKKELKI